MASSKKFFFDVGVLIFPDHTFDNLIPLKVKDPSLGDDKVYGAMGINTDGIGENKRWGDVVILNKDKVFLSSQERSSFLSAHGNSGGPLINNKGEVVGIISGAGINEFGDTFDMYSSLLLEENYSFLQNIVRQNGIKIKGIQ